MIRSTALFSTPAFARQRSAAWQPMSLAVSSGAAIRRSRIPVREMIHSSDVSTAIASSMLVNFFVGTYPPMPEIRMPMCDSSS